LTQENVIVVEAIGKWEWTRLWENLDENLFESPISMQDWEMSVVMEKMRISPPEQEKAQSAPVLLRVALFFGIEKFLQNLTVRNLCNFVVKGVATTLPEEHHLDIGQVYAKSNDPGTGMLGLNLWEYFMKLNIMKWPGTEIAERGIPSEGKEAGDGGVYPDRDTGIWGLNLLLNTLNFITKWSAIGTGTGEQGNLHVGGTNTPGERDEAEGGEGGDNNDNCEC